MLKIRRPLGRLIFNMGIAIPGKTVFLIETAPCGKVTAWYWDLTELHKFFGRSTSGSCFNIKYHITSIGIPIIKIRWSWDHHIFLMGMPILKNRWALGSVYRMHTFVSISAFYFFWCLFIQCSYWNNGSGFDDLFHFMTNLIDFCGEWFSPF